MLNMLVPVNSKLNSLTHLKQVIDRLVEAGARLVLLRRGPQGSMVHDASTGETWEVPAVPESVVVDPTGCGNAYCGGFLAAWSGGESLVDAACWGSCHQPTLSVHFCMGFRTVPHYTLYTTLQSVPLTVADLVGSR
jgi:sugar/nucleoside kinase (ribokinase family)